MTVSSSDAENVLDAEFQVDGVDLLELNVPEAQVQLRPHDANRVHVRGFVPTVKSEANQDRPGPPNLSTRHSDDRLHIFRQGLSRDISDWRRRVRNRTTIHLDIRVPPRLDVTARTPGGAIDAVQLGGTLDLTVRGGSVYLEQMSGPLRLRGSGGRLTTQDISGSSLEVKWAAGPVTLEHVRDAQTALEAQAAPTIVQDHHGSVDLCVHGAPLTLHDLEGPCDAEVRGNRLTYRGTPAHDTSLRTVGGSVQAFLPSAHAASLTVTGAHVALDDDFAFEGKTTPHRIEGVLNGGGPDLALRAVQGTASCRVQNEA